MKGDRDAYFSTEHLRDRVGSRVIRGGALTLIAQAAQFILSMAGTVVLARLLTPQDYGLIGMVTVVTGFLTLFKDLGLSQATVQREELTHGQTTNLFWVNVGASTLIALVAASLAPLIARFYGEPRLTSITMVLALGFVFGGFTVQHQALLTRQMRFGLLAASSVIAAILGLAVGIVLAWRGASYWALVGQQLTVALVTAAAAWIFCDWRPGLPSRGSGVRELVAFGGNITGFNVVNYFARNGDNLLIGKVWGPAALGLYAKAYQLLLLPLTQINYPVAAVLVPTLSRLANDPARYRAAFVRTLEKLLMVTMPGIVFLMVTADWAVRVVLGPQWTEAATIFSWLAVAGFLQPVGTTTGWLFVSQNRTRAMFKWGVIGSTMAIASILIGLPWGAVGVAMSYGVSGLLIRTPVGLWYVGREGPVRTRDFYVTMAPFAIAAICSGLAVLGYRCVGSPSGPLVGLVTSFAIAAPVALGVMALTRAGRAAIRDMIHSLSHLRPSRGATA
ncbi:MAG TPA: lipopolysaccharide biosynthesis protein [Gemmatimonadaceae bacterium]|nr:lipopolysaccharide biosynthesis protein [Gemmatimonadaceae bacterium]